MKKLLLVIVLVGSLYAKEQTIGFAAGCFWGVEKKFESMDGVLSASSGYTGGDYDDPSYKKVLKHRFDSGKGKNHTETVRVVYDDQKVSTQKLIKTFWEMHNPTQGDRQGNDRGSNYRSALFYTTEDQRKLAIETKGTYQKLLSQEGYGNITTEVSPLKKFYPAESYHQDYLKKNPNGYCPDHSTGVKFEKKVQKIDFIKPHGGKEIVVIDADGCPFCEKFAKDVSDSYSGDIPLRTVRKDRLKGFKISSKLDATPTILLTENGKEIYAYRGYLNKKEFYKLIGTFKLGDKSEAFNVAFNQGTDGRFCKQYDKFKNTGDGVFVDILSGDILFDTKDRFKSGTGWLSFYKSVNDATIEKEDISYGMKRVEVVAAKSGIHLGHVFDDAPNGKRRFCINATVLKFIPRANIN
ncbi:MAG: peptide-methionine (S)-S-oxide reductase MsrA [Sulfurovum sp.]|nr:peptide-methionine (S)-S-oxide reductase MsrA [Sulfurovum sp.]